MSKKLFSIFQTHVEVEGITIHFLKKNVGLVHAIPSHAFNHGIIVRLNAYPRIVAIDMAIEWRREQVILTRTYDDKFLSDGGFIYHNDQLVLYDQGEEVETFDIVPGIGKTIEWKFSTNIIIDKD
jgi:hypothetical protein